jgi:hypothetical protein
VNATHDRKKFSPRSHEIVNYSSNSVCAGPLHPNQFGI